MPTTLLRFALFFAALTPAVRAADAFEGRIHMEMTDAKKQMVPIDYAMKDGKIRIDLPADKNGGGAGAGGVIMDMPHSEMIILMSMQGQKMFMRRPIAMPTGAPQSKGAPSSAASTMAPPVPTGRTATIAGYPATEYKVAGDDGGTTELWLAQGLGSFMSPTMQNPMARGQSAKPAPGWEKFTQAGGMFPLRAITRNAAGVEQSHLEVTKIEKTTLPAAVFSTDGYSEFQIPGFGGGGFNPGQR